MLFIEAPSIWIPCDDVHHMDIVLTPRYLN
jgi:hypothetical protein